MRLRVTEECARSTRYARPLSVMVLQVEGTGSTLREWLLRGLRSTDLVCRTVEGDYYVLLTETDASGTSEVMKRLLAEVPVHRVWSASFLTETERFKSLLDPLDATLPTV